MPSIVAVELAKLPYRVSQNEVMVAIKRMFQHRSEHIDRLLSIFNVIIFNQDRLYNH